MVAAIGYCNERYWGLRCPTYRNRAAIGYCNGTYRVPSYLQKIVDQAKSASITNRLSWARARRKSMAWTTPTLVEICIGLEINGYLPAEF